MSTPSEQLLTGPEVSLKVISTQCLINTKGIKSIKRRLLDKIVGRRAAQYLGRQGAHGGWNCGVGGLGENPWSLTHFTWDTGQLALLPRPSGSSSVRWTLWSQPLLPVGRCTGLQGAGADCGLTGPSLCSTCISGVMLCTSEPCPGTPMLRAQEWAVVGSQGPQGILAPSVINLVVSGVSREVGVQG